MRVEDKIRTAVADIDTGAYGDDAFAASGADQVIGADGELSNDQLVRYGDRVFLVSFSAGDTCDWHEFNRCDTVDELALDLSVYFGCRRPVEAVAMLLGWQDQAVENLGESGSPGQPGWSRRWKLTLGGETAVVAERVEALGSGWEKVDSEAGA